MIDELPLKLECIGKSKKLVGLWAEYRAIRFAGKRWPIVGKQTWCGNWCWNAYYMGISTAADFLCWIHGKGWFDCIEAESTLLELWNSKEPLLCQYINDILFSRLMRQVEDN
jgi:hypothetical protein